MSKTFRFLSSLLLAAAVTASTGCGGDRPPALPPFGSQDGDGIESVMSKEEATAIAETACEGLNQQSYALWTTRWDQSMLDAIKEADWRAAIPSFTNVFGRYQKVLSTEKAAASTPGRVRFNFLVQFERGQVMLVHVYPKDGTRITGVMLRQPNGQPL